MQTIDYRATWAARCAAVAAFTAAFGIRAETDDDSRYEAIRQQQQRLVERSNQVLATADAEGRPLSDAERRAIQRRTLEIEALDEEATEIDARPPTPQARHGGAMADPLGKGPGGTYGPSATGGMPSIGGQSFAKMFPQARGTEGFQTLGEFAQAVHQRHPRLFGAGSGMSESVGADGGFYVPQGFFAGLMDASLTQEAIRPNAMVIPMTSGSVTVPMFDTSDRSTGIATLEGKTTAEGATGTTQKAKVRSIGLTAKKISVLVPTTAELLQDAPQLFGGLLQQAMQDALAQTLDTWFIGGNGVGQPLGIMNSPCLVSVAKDSGQAAGTLTPTNIANCVSRLSAGSWARARWIVSPSALAALFTLKTVVTNVAGDQNVGGFAPEFFSVLPDGKFALCGRPLIVSDRCQALGTKGDVLLCDLSSFLIGIRQRAELAVDTSIGFKESEVWFRLNCRIDGQPVLAAPITPRVGSATLSPFVTLDTRG